MLQFVRVSLMLGLLLALAACAHPVQLQFMESATGSPLANLPVQYTQNRTVGFLSSSYSTTMTADKAGTVVILDFAETDFLATIPPMQHVQPVALSRDGSRIAVVDLPATHIPKCGGPGCRCLTAENGTSPPRYTIRLTAPHPKSVPGEQVVFLTR